MKRTAMALVVLLSGCISGPNYLSNSVRDARNKSYVENPIGTALITDVLPVYPLVELLASVPDVLVVNPIQFWGFDIWRGKGTGFRHDNPPRGKESWLESLVARADEPFDAGREPVALPASMRK